MSTVWITCGKCPNKWTGLNTCHCSACHLTFTSPTTFHKHRIGFVCQPPADVGLVEHPRGNEDYKYVAWGGPLDDEGAKRLARYRAERAQGGPEEVIDTAEVAPPALGQEIDTYIETGDWLERERPIREEE